MARERRANSWPDGFKGAGGCHPPSHRERSPTGRTIRHITRHTPPRRCAVEAARRVELEGEDRHRASIHRLGLCLYQALDLRRRERPPSRCHVPTLRQQCRCCQQRPPLAPQRLRYNGAPSAGEASGWSRCEAEGEVVRRTEASGACRPSPRPRMELKAGGVRLVRTSAPHAGS